MSHPGTSSDADEKMDESGTTAGFRDRTSKRYIRQQRLLFSAKNELNGVKVRMERLLPQFPEAREHQKRLIAQERQHSAQLAVQQRPIAESLQEQGSQVSEN